MDVQQLSTQELLTAVQTQSLSNVDLVRHCLTKIEQTNADINAFVNVFADKAMAQAEAIDRRRTAGETIGALQGLPVGIKDNICFADAPTTCGSRMLENFRPPYDAHVVQQIIAHDGIIIGQCNMDEFAMGSTTETSIHGSAHNPSDHNRTTGGSSGGSAAAVAAGMVPLTLGSDTGGSIRQPASFCGVVGMKPTYGRVSRFGLVAFASSLDQIGPLAKDVHGASLLLSVISGHDSRDSTSVQQKPTMVASAADLKGIKIGVVEEHYSTGIDTSVQDSVQQAIQLLKQAGAEVVPIALPHSKYCVAVYYLIAPCEASSNLARYDGIHYGRRTPNFDSSTDGLVDLYRRSRSEGFGPEVKRRIMLGTYALSAGYYDAYYLKALKVRRRIREDYDKAFAGVDVIVGPVAPTPAFEQQSHQDDPLAMYLSDIYTISANLAGIPAISLPCGLSNDGLPIGLQLQGPAFAEERLLSIAESVQELLDNSSSS